MDRAVMGEIMRVVIAALILIMWGGCESGIAVAQSLDLQERVRHPSGQGV